MKEKKHTKLTSRKFWTALGTAAYFAAMAIKEQYDGNQLASIIFGICVGGVIVAWIMIEGFCDYDNEIEEADKDGD